MKTMDSAFAREFATRWIDAWNAHDLDRVLAHYTDDFVMSSPVIVQIVGEPSGTLHGKAQVGAYWKKALTIIPDVHFELIDVLAGVESIVIYFKGARGRIAAEVFEFDSAGKVHRSFANYA